MGVWHEPEDNTMYMDSVLRKRRLKMKAQVEKEKKSQRIVEEEVRKNCKNVNRNRQKRRQV